MLHFVQNRRDAWLPAGACRGPGWAPRETRGTGTCSPKAFVVLPGAASHRGYDGVDLETIHAVVAEANHAFDDARVPHLLIGGLASAALGQPRASGDVDFFVAPHDARRALEALAGAGFDTDETNPHWIFKGFKHGVLVDVMFKTKGDVYLDDEMLARALRHDVGGRSVPIMPPEDLVVVKAFAHEEESPRHWFDALAVVASVPLDWEYLIRRAMKGPRRVLSLLVYATSVDLVVPPTTIRRLYDMVFGAGAGELE